MATQEFSPDIIAALRKAAPIVQKAKTAVNPFATFAGPDGRYYARLKKIIVGLNKDSKITFTFFNTCLSKCPDSQSNSTATDTEFAGASMRMFSSTAASDKQTEQEAWDRAMVNLQAYDILTENWGNRKDPVSGVVSYHPELFHKDMFDALAAINENPPALVIDVVTSKDGKYKNCNPRETVDDVVVQKFARPSLEVTPEEMQIAELEANQPAVSDFVPQWPFTAEQAKQMIEEASEEELRQSTAACPADFDLPPLPFNLETLTLDRVKEVALALLTNQPLPADLLGVTLDPDVAVPVRSDSASSDELLEEEEEEEEEAVEEAPKFSPEKVHLWIATLDRTARKREIANRGGLAPDEKFTTKQTDEFLGEWLFGLLAGTMPQKSLPKITEMPPF